MILGLSLRKSYGEFQERWRRMVDTAFGEADSALLSESARGEFISPFISDAGRSPHRAKVRSQRKPADF